MKRCHCYPEPGDPRAGTGCGGCPAAQELAPPAERERLLVPARPWSRALGAAICNTIRTRTRE